MKLIPEFINPSVKSNAEKKIFDLFKSNTSATAKGYIIYHSLGIAEHMYTNRKGNKRYAELDFVVLCSKGILALEIKGGAVSSSNGEWFFTNRFGRTTRKRESPIQQVKDGAFSLEKIIEEELGVKNVLVGFGTMFPDMLSDKIKGVEWGHIPIFTYEHTKEPLSQYIDDLYEYWEDKTRKKTDELDNDLIYDIGQLIRPEIDATQPLWVRFDSLEAERVVLTKKQYKCLDQLAECPRLIIKGCAGSGKTLIAMEKAKRMASTNMRTLFLVSTKILAVFLREQLKQFEDPQYNKFICIKSLKEFMIETISKHIGIVDCYNKNDAEMRDLFKKACEIGHLKVWDTLIIDEAQDFLCKDLCFNLHKIISGGFSKGNIYIFYDDKQLVHYSHFDKKFLAFLYGEYNIVPFTLTENCRNTPHIQRGTSMLTGLHLLQSDMRDSGLQVAYYSYETQKELHNKFNKCIDELTFNKILPKDITILYSSDSGFKSFLNNVESNNNDIVFKELNHKNIRSKKDRICYHSTIANFKGLERDVIIMLGVDDVYLDSKVSQNYVACTRAKNKLVIFYDKQWEKEIKQRMQEFSEHSGSNS